MYESWWSNYKKLYYCHRQSMERWKNYCKIVIFTRLDPHSLTQNVQQSNRRKCHWCDRNFVETLQWLPMDIIYLRIIPESFRNDYAFEIWNFKIGNCFFVKIYDVLGNEIQNYSRWIQMRLFGDIWYFGFFRVYYYKIVGSFRQSWKCYS